MQLLFASVLLLQLPPFSVIIQKPFNLHIPPVPFPSHDDAFTSSLRRQPSQTKIVHHILDLLDTVLDAVAALAQSVVLEVEDLEAGVDVFDELADLHRLAVVALGHGVAG